MIIPFLFEIDEHGVFAIGAMELLDFRDCLLPSISCASTYLISFSFDVR